jgi:hypothetical protein
MKPHLKKLKKLLEKAEKITVVIDKKKGRIWAGA